jgi:hypothetical protein
MNPNKALWEKGDFPRIAQTMRECGELSTAETKCAKWRRESVPVGLREEGCEAPVLFCSFVLIYALAAGSPSFGVLGFWPCP